MTTLTPQQTAETLAVSAQTLRRWSVQFAEFLSKDATPGRGRRRQYTVADLALLRRAGDLFRAGHSVEDTIALLRVTIDQADTRAIEALTLPTIAGELQTARNLVHQLNDRVAALETDRAALAGQVDDLKRSHADQASTHQADLQALRDEVEALKARRSWWDRVRGR